MVLHLVPLLDLVNHADDNNAHCHGERGGSEEQRRLACQTGTKRTAAAAARCSRALVQTTVLVCC